MTVIHVGKRCIGQRLMNNTQMTATTVLFRFLPTVSSAHKAEFVRELKKLKKLPCVKDERLFVNGPSITDPIERSKGFEIALVSFHHDRKSLEDYQRSAEHHEYVWTSLWCSCDALIRAPE